ERQRDRQRQAAENAQHLAEDRLTLAKHAVDTYLKAAAADPELQKADLSLLRKKLLEAAIPFYRKLTEYRSDDPELQAERGWAHGRLGMIFDDLGEARKAIAEHGKMRELLAEVAARHPEKASYRRDLA